MENRNEFRVEAAIRRQVRDLEGAQGRPTREEQSDVAKDGGGDSRVTARRQFTIMVPQELGSYIEELSAEMGMNKSAVVSQVLADDRKRRKEQLLHEGYEEMAPYDRELLQEFEHVDGDASWPEY